MLFFVFWVLLLVTAILAVPVASWLDKRKLEAAFSGVDSGDGYEDEAGGDEVTFDDAEAAAASGAFDTVPDGDEARGADLLEGLGGDDMISQFPDFDVAYLTAAYPAGPMDHDSASEGLLQNGLHGSVRKSWLLGRLSSYHLAKGDPQQAFEYGVKSLLSTNDVSAPEVAATINYLQPVFEATKHADLAAKLQSLKSLPNEDADFQKSLKKTVKKVSGRKNKALIAEAAELLRSTEL